MVALPLAASWNYQTIKKRMGFPPPKSSPDLEKQLKVHQTHQYSKEATGLLLHTAFSVGV